MRALLALLALVVGANATCSSFLVRDECIISTEQDITCSWCLNKDTKANFCLTRAKASSLTNTHIWCDAGDDEILTRALPIVVTPAAENVEGNGSDYVPVVFMHGIGDSGSNPGMKSLAASVSSKYPGLYSVAVNVANGMSSYTTDIGQQVKDFADTVAADPKLARGFTAVGLSQGGLIVRIYAQVYNNPPVHSLVSLCGPQNGVGECPGGTPEFICNLVRDHMYAAPISFAGYWRNSMDEAKYLNESRWLADWNNDRDTKNATYAQNIMNLKKYVAVEALQDTVVIPHLSEQHGFFKWGSTTEYETFNQTASYAGDWLGLKTLDSQGDMILMSYEGNHLRWSQTFWNENIVPIFDATFDEAPADRRSPLIPRIRA